MKALLFDKEDVEYLSNIINKFPIGYATAVIRLKEMQPNKDTLRIVKERKLI